MKTILYFLLFCVVIPAGTFAQSDQLNRMIHKYKSVEGFRYLDVNTNMISAETDKVVNLKLISFDAEKNTSFVSDNLRDEFYKGFNEKEFKGLVEVKSSGDNVEMMVKKEGDKVSHIIISVLGESETVFISVSGNMTMKDLGKFSDFENCHGLQVLEQLCEE